MNFSLPGVLVEGQCGDQHQRWLLHRVQHWGPSYQSDPATRHGQLHMWGQKPGSQAPE